MTPLTSQQAHVEGLLAAGILSIPVADTVMFIFVVILIFCIVWLSSRHIRTSRTHIRAYEKTLGSERDSLERRIAERTTEFVRAEEQRMIELERNAEFGKLSQGLFHDLISPLSAVSLYAQQLEEETGHSHSDKIKEMIKTIINSSKRMNSFMESVRRSLGNEGAYQNNVDSTDQANIKKEIGVVLDILGYKARMAGVKIKVKIDQETQLPIHPVRLHQLILNLVQNAIDACIQKSVQDQPEGAFGGKSGKKSNYPEHVVTVSVVKKEMAENSEMVGKTLVELSVSDTGCGISPENLARMFKKQFTTKNGGTGIGLITIRTIVEQDLRGTIEVSSEEGKGARFVIKIPISTNSTNKKYV